MKKYLSMNKKKINYLTKYQLFNKYEMSNSLLENLNVFFFQTEFVSYKICLIYFVIELKKKFNKCIHKLSLHWFNMGKNPVLSFGTY